MVQLNNAAMEGQYSFVEDLFSSVPELAALVKRLSAQGASASTFQDALQTTAWWRNNSGTARQMVGLQNADPASYNQQQTAAYNHVQQTAAQMGVTLTQAQIQSYATADLFQGLDDATLKTQIGANYNSSANKSLGGDAADLNSQITAAYQDYGVPMSQATADSWVNQNLTTGQTATETMAGVTQQLKNSAKSLYPGWSDQIDSGMTMKQVAQPYVDSMATTLELPPTSITLNDPTIQSAMQDYTSGSPSGGSSGSSGTNSTPGVTPLYAFQNQLRQDPRWGQTDNAKQSAYSMLHNLGQSFGFAS